MIILDENIDIYQRRQLDRWRIHFRLIGAGVGRFGMDDREEIIPLLHSLRRPTFFTRDRDFYHPWLRHPGYCMVFLEVSPDDVAQFIRRSYAIDCFARKRNEWAQLCAFTKTVSTYGASAQAGRKKYHGERVMAVSKSKRV